QLIFLKNMYLKMKVSYSTNQRYPQDFQNKIKLFSFIIWMLALSQNFIDAQASSSCDTSTCQQCQTSNGQVSCSTCINSSYKILQNGCVATCPSYTQEVNGICNQICYESCSSCSGSEYFKCLTCRDNRDLELSFFFQYGECNCNYSFTDDLSPTCQDSSTSSIFNTIVFSLALVSLIAIILLSLIQWSGFILYYYIDSLQCAALLYYINYQNSYQLDDLIRYIDKSNISSTLKPDWYRGESNYNTSYLNWKVAKHINSSNFAVEQIIVFIFTLLLWIIAFFSIKYYQTREINKKKGINSENNSLKRRSDKLSQRLNNQNSRGLINSANSSLNISLQQKSLSQIQEEQVEDDLTKNIKKRDQALSQRDINDISSRNSKNNLFKKQNGSAFEKNNQSQLNSNRISQNSSNMKYLVPPQRKQTFNQSKSSLNSIVIYDSNEPSNFRFSKGMQNRETSEGNKGSQHNSQININNNNNQQNKYNKNINALQEPQSQYYKNTQISQISQKKQIKVQNNNANILQEHISNKNPFSISIIIFFFMITIQETLIVIIGQFNYSFTFQNPGTTASTGFCLLMIVYIIAILFFLFKKLFKNKIKQNQELQSDYNVLFYLIDNYNQEKFYQRCYFAISFCRKLISSIACSVLHKSPLAQTIILLCNQAVYIIYIMACKPIKNNQEKYLIFLAHSEVLLCFLFQTIIISKDSSSYLEKQSINKYTEGLIFILIILLITFILYSLYILIQWIIQKCKKCTQSQKKKKDINKKEKQQVYPEKVLVPVEVPVEQPIEEKAKFDQNDDELKRKVEDLQKELQDVKARQDSIDKLQILEVKEEVENSQYDGKLILFEDPHQHSRYIQDESFREDLDEKRKLLKSQSIQVNSKMFESGQQSTVLPPSSEKKKRYVQSRQTQVDMEKEFQDSTFYNSQNSDYQKQSIVYESVIQEKTEEDSEIKKNKIYHTQELQVDSTCFEKPKIVVEAQVQTQHIPTPKNYKDQAVGGSQVFGAEEDESEQIIQFSKQPRQQDFSSQTQPIEIESPKNKIVDEKPQQSVLDKIIKEIQEQEIPKLNQNQMKTNDAGSQYTAIEDEPSERQTYPLTQASVQHTTTIQDKPIFENNNESKNIEKTPIFTNFIKNQTPQRQSNYTHNKVSQKKASNGLKWGETNKFDKYCNGKEMHSKIQNQRSKINSFNNTIQSNEQLSINPNIYLGPTTPQHSKNYQNNFKEIELPNSARSDYKNNDDSHRYGNIFSRGAQNSLQTIQIDQPSSLRRYDNRSLNRTPSQNQEQYFQKPDPLKSNINNYLSNQSPSQSRSTERSRSNILNLQPMPKAFDLNSKIII
ncbi:transmembrane protein, putative, partial (macronuclear) [Tetrahymena thermophila SB210]